MDRLVTITFLEMTSREQIVPLMAEQRLDVRRAGIPSPELNRFLYATVGADWSWHERLGWDRERWTLWLDRPEVETWIGYLDGTPAGYFELEAQTGGAVEIVYFGLLPAFIGRGLGPELLDAAVQRAWSLAKGRIWVHTCTLDHPRALVSYQDRGFRVYDAVEKMERLPDVPATPWPTATRK